MMKTGIAVCAAALCASAQAQVFYDGFELPTHVGSAAGTLLTENGWYQPVAGGVAANVYTYSGNALGLVQNPVGGNQFMGGVSGGAPLFARAQQDINFGPGTWTLSFDMAVNWLGTGSSSSFLGSFSLQNPTTTNFRGFIGLNDFVDLADPSAGFKSMFRVFDAAGTPVNDVFPGTAWENLSINNWYRQYITIDFDANRIVSVGLVDLHSGSAAFASPIDWYLDGGAQPVGMEMPTGIRAFVGGAAGNAIGWDNIYVIPSPGAAAILALGGLVAMRRRR